MKKFLRGLAFVFMLIGGGVSFATTPATGEKIILSNFEAAQKYMWSHNLDLKIKQEELLKAQKSDQEAQRKINNLEKDYDMIMRYGGRDARVQTKVQVDVNKAQSKFNVEIANLMIDITKEKLTQGLKQLLTQQKELKSTLSYMEQSYENLGKQLNHLEVQLKLGNILNSDYDKAAIEKKKLENNINRTQDGLKEVQRQLKLLLNGSVEGDDFELAFDFQVSPYDKTYDLEVVKNRLLSHQSYLEIKERELEFKKKEFEIYARNYLDTSYEYGVKAHEFEIAKINHQKNQEKTLNELYRQFNEITRLRYDVIIADKEVLLAAALHNQAIAKHKANLITQSQLMSAEAEVLNKNIQALKTKSKFNQAVDQFEYFLDYGLSE